jgi:putative pyruvate formate lyase activating enzyme
VQIYLADYKYIDNQLGKRYSGVNDYAEIAWNAIEEMYRQTGSYEMDADGILQKGLLIRHLIMPGKPTNTKGVIDLLTSTLPKGSFLFSLMSQYTPMRQFHEFPELNRRIYSKEYNRVVDYAIELGIENAFIQEGKASVKSFIPQFDNSGV